MPRQWTPEAKAAVGERMRQRWAERKAKATPQVSNETQLPNPIADDVLPPAPKPVRKKHKSDIVSVPPPSATELPVVTEIIDTLETIPLESISYSECGLLLNALSVCSTAVALARRQKQEQLEAGTSRAPCKTCGRMIDISKAGGFQILTERDEFHMPRNSFYCSQNCLLARNMPSHAKQTPRDKRENRA